MIANRVKAQIALRRRTSFRRAARALCAVALLLFACSGAPPKPNETKASEVKPAAGAERWREGALLLPAESPAVFVGRLDEILDAAERLKSWIVKEPAMLGEDGETTARSIDAGWLAAKGYLGVDPFDARAWVERGVDPTRPIYAGLYPIDGEGKRFLASVDATIRREIGLPPGGAIGPSLRALSETTDELPEGTNARILRSLEGTRPFAGMRVVVPVTSAREFLTTVTSFAEGMGLTPFPADVIDEPLPPETHAFRAADSGPVMMVSVEGSHGVIDLLSPAFAGKPPAQTADSNADAQEAWHQLQRARTTVRAGRPLAPAPADSSSVAMTFDQRGTADLIRIAGYRHSLQTLHSTRTDRRDADLLEGLLVAVSEAEVWEVAADELTGTSFELTVGGGAADRIGRISMTLFAAHRLPPLGEPAPYPSLGVQQHSAAFGLSLAEMRGDDWRGWFADGTAREIDQLDVAGVDPMRLGLPLARLLAITGSNIGDPEGLRVASPIVADTLLEFEGVSRAEFMSTSPDVSDFATAPKMLAAFVLDPDAERRPTIDVIQAAFTGMLAGWLDLPAEPSVETPPLKEGETTELNIDGVGAIQQHLTQTKPSVVVYGVGIDREEFEREIAALSTGTTAASIVEGRLEPIALLSWLRAGDPGLFEPIDAEILAQRLGPLVLNYSTRRVGESNAVTLDLTLNAPPKL